MADLPISGLTAAGALAGTEPLPIVQGGATKKTTVQDVANLGVYTKDAENNVFYNGVTATLGTGSRRNIFHQGATGNVLGDDCRDNVVEQVATGFTFRDSLRLVTIKSGAVGADYTAIPDYDFLYGNLYSSEIFRNPEGTANYHRYYDPTNDQIVLTLLEAPFTVSYIGGGGGGGDVYLANDQTFTGENTFAIASGSKEPIIVTKGGNGAGIKVTKSSGSGDAIEVAEGSLSIADETASRIASFDGSKRVKSLNTTTYPSLTELSYVKGVTSAIQTQLSNITIRTSNLIDNGFDGTANSATSNTLSSSGLITPDQINAGDCLEIISFVKKSGVSGTLTVRFYANTTNDLLGTPILIGISSAVVPTTLQTVLQRFIRIKVKNGTGTATEVMNTSVAQASDISTSVISAVSTLAIDWTTVGGIYLIVAVQNASGTDTSRSTLFKVRR
jgi:hypothetical protein